MALASRTAAVFGFASHRSLAWGVAEAFHRAGCTNLVIGLQTDRFVGALEKLTASWPVKPTVVLCDATKDEQVEEARQKIADAIKGAPLDVLVHSMAFATQASMRAPTAVLDCSRDDFMRAMDVSAFSLVSLSKALSPLMITAKKDEGAEAAASSSSSSSASAIDDRTGSIITMSYLGGERVVPGYKVMGPTKATLEHLTRYLASDLGPSGVRVNAISAGPIETLAARGIPGFTQLKTEATAKSPLRRAITLEDVGNASVFLASEASSAITGTVLHVDCGAHIMAG